MLWPAANMDLWMGCWKDVSMYNGNWLCLNGLMSEVRIWKGART